jgi:hypothetical protein
MKLNVYGKIVEAIYTNNNWKLYYLGDEGKKRLANDISVPSNIKEKELVNYISDICHEWATPVNGEVKILNQE